MTLTLIFLSGKHIFRLFLAQNMLTCVVEFPFKEFITFKLFYEIKIHFFSSCKINQCQLKNVFKIISLEHSRKKMSQHIMFLVKVIKTCTSSNIIFKILLTYDNLNVSCKAYCHMFYAKEGNK